MSDLYCALCLLTRNGIAVCYDHAKVMTSGDFASVLAYLRDHQDRR